MKLKKEYTYTSSKQIWRLIPTDTGKLIIEDRDLKNKEVFFSCLKIESGKTIFKNLQLEDKFWTGIETVYNDIIYFHKFQKPDMPIHKGIVAFDINLKKVLWRTDDYNYLFVTDSRIFVYKNKFEGKDFFTLDYKTGAELENLGDDYEKINRLKEETESSNEFEQYILPEQFNSSANDRISNVINELKIDKVITGKINFIKLDGILLTSCHEVLPSGSLRNIFRVIEVDSKKVILEEILDKDTKLFIPESFFIVDKLLFLLKEKAKFTVYTIK
jgi:Domain of unknown function (DUF4905)